MQPPRTENLDRLIAEVEKTLKTQKEKAMSNDYEPPMVIRRSRMPQFAIGVGPQKYQHTLPQELDKLPWSEDLDVLKMSIAEKIVWVILFGMMVFGLWRW